MAKSRRNRGSRILKNVVNTSRNVIPSIYSGLNNVGNAAKGVTKKTEPLVEKGVSTVFGTLATGFDLGLKGAKTVASGVKTVAKRVKTVAKGKKSKRRGGRK